MTEWRRTKWGEVASLAYGRALRGPDGGAFRVFGTNGPIGWHSAALCGHAGVIIGRKGAYRGVHYSSEPFFVIDTAFFLVAKAPVDMRWAYYALLTADINGLDSGSAIPSTTRESFGSLPCLLPPLPEQRAIAAVLGAFDDKIEVNRRMSEALEAMARALFKSWFVDFDPVRAKAAGRDPGVPRRIAGLFPASLAESQIGRVPRAWGTGALVDDASIISGGTPSTACPEYWSGDINWFAVADAPHPGQPWVLRTQKQISSAGLAASPASILPVGATIITARGTVGLTALVGAAMAMNQSCYAICPPRGTEGFYAYYALRNAVGRLRCQAHGSVFDTITRSTLTGTLALRPPTAVAVAFEEAVAPALRRCLCALRAADTLAALRDALLPKLISGEIRVKQAEKIAQAAL